MLAVCGYVAPEIWRWSGEIAPGLKFADIPNGIAALDAIPSLGWSQMFFLIGAVDYYGTLGSFEIGSAPGVDAQFLERRKLSELTHGRLAMLAILELLRHDSQNLVSPGFDGLITSSLDFHSFTTKFVRSGNQNTGAARHTFLLSL